MNEVNPTVILVIFLAVCVATTLTTGVLILLSTYQANKVRRATAVATQVAIAQQTTMLETYAQKELALMEQEQIDQRNQKIAATEGTTQ